MRGARNALAVFANPIDRNDPDAAPRSDILAHERGIAGAAVTEAERIAHDDAANSKRSNQEIEKAAGDSVAIRSSNRTKKHSSKPAPAIRQSRSSSVQIIGGSVPGRRCVAG